MRYALWALAGLLAAPAAAGAAVSGETVTMTPMPLSAFARAFGVNTHREQGLEVDDVDALAGELRALGVSTLRIANPAADQAQIAAGGVDANQQFYLRLARAAGIRYVVFISSQPVLADELAAARVLARAGALRAIEGINEANNFAVTYQGETTRTDDRLLEALQADLYRAVKADPDLSAIPVYDYTGPARRHAFPRVGRADYATIHPYSRAGQQARFGLGVAAQGGIQAVNLAQAYSNDVTARVITENGYAAPPDGHGSDAVPLSEQGRLIETTLSDAVLDGYDVDLVYELTDSGPGDRFGFYDHEHHAKPSGVALGHLLQLMADPRTAQTSAPLTLSFSAMPATARRNLFQASDGTNVLELWNEPPDGAPAPLVTVGLRQRYHVVSVLDGVTGATLSTAHDAETVSLPLLDHPVLVKFRQ